MAGWEKQCSVEACDKIVGMSGARGFCPKHYTRFRLYGDVTVDRTHESKKPTKGNLRHGGYTFNRNEYNSYRAMKARCYSPKYRAYARYGGRGIKVVDRWLGKDGFLNFLADMGKKPTAKHSLDRIDNDGDYTPENCRWATQKEQMNNMMRNRTETINGITKTVSQWCEDTGVRLHSVYNRLKDGWDFEKALTTPMNKPGQTFGNNSKKRRLPRKDCLNCGNPCKWASSVYCTRDCYLYVRWGYSG